MKQVDDDHKDSRVPHGSKSTTGNFLGSESRHVEYGSLVLVTLLGAVLRISYIDASMRWDEAVVSRWAEDWDLYDIVSYYRNIGNHVLHTLAMTATQALFGFAPWSARLPALLAGIALVPVTFLAASSLFSRPVGLMAAGLVAGSPYLVFYSINSRGYMLQCLLVMLLLWFLARLSEAPSRRSTVAAGAVGALALFTLPTTILVLPGLYVGMTLRAVWGRDRAHRRTVIRTMVTALLITGGIAVLLYLPLLVRTLDIGFEQLQTHFLPGSSTATVVWRHFGHVVRGSAERWAWGLPLPGQMLFAAMAGIGIFYLERRYAGSLAVILLTVTTTIVIVLMLMIVPGARAYVFLIPFFFMVVGGGIQAILKWYPTRRVGLASPVVVLLAAGGMIWTWSSGWIGSLDDTGRIAGAEAAMVALAETVGPRDRVVPAFPQLSYYARLHDLPIRFKFTSRDDPSDVDNIYVFVRVHRETLDETLDQRLGRTTGVLDAFGEPEFVGAWPDLRVFVMSRRE